MSGATRSSIGYLTTVNGERDLSGVEPLFHNKGIDNSYNSRETLAVSARTAAAESRRVPHSMNLGAWRCPMVCESSSTGSAKI